MPTPKDLLSRLWRRHQHPANWCLHLGAACCLCLGMWTGSGTAASAAIVLLGAGFLDFHLPAKGPAWLRRVIQAEVVWVNSPWTRTKRIQTALIVLFVLIGVGCLLADFLPGMLLLVGWPCCSRSAATTAPLAWTPEPPSLLRENSVRTPEHTATRSI